MALEREKRSALAPLYRAAKEALPRLDISQQNVGYYASLATYYSIYDLRRLQPQQTHLYWLCYSWQRYRQWNDNLADAFDFPMKQVEDATQAAAEQHFTKALATVFARIFALYPSSESSSNSGGLVLGLRLKG